MACLKLPHGDQDNACKVTLTSDQVPLDPRGDSQLAETPGGVSIRLCSSVYYVSVGDAKDMGTVEPFGKHQALYTS